jgi:hypothetical protein
MADVVSLAQDLYDEAVSDPAFMAALKAARKALLAGMLSGGTYGSIVTASKNGASYTIRVDVSTEDRRNALKLAVNGIKTGVRPSRTYHARFYGSC